MKKHALLGGFVLLALVVGAGWSADDPKKPTDDPKLTPKGTLPANWKKIGLTDDQVKKVYKVQAEYRTKIDDLQQKISDLKQKEKSEMEALLTDAQKARLKELKTGDTDKTTDKSADKSTDKKPPSGN